MTVWWAAFFVLGVLTPPGIPFEWTAVLGAVLASAWALGAAGACPRLRAEGTCEPGRAAALCVVTVVTGLLVWEAAGLERRSHDACSGAVAPRESRATTARAEPGGAAERSRRRTVDPRKAPGALEGLRERLIESLDDGRLGRTGTGIVGALVLDHRAGLGFDLNESYSYLGITHFLALSGMHLGVIAVPLSRVCAALVRSRSGRDVLLFSILCLYAAVAAFPASLSRALAGLGAVILYRLLGLRPGILAALLGGCLALVAVDPAVVFDAGFELSFAAVCGIALIGVPLSRVADARLPRGAGGAVLRAFAFPAIITCSVQFLTMPLTIVLFKRASLISPVVNVIVSMPFTALLYLGVLYVFVPLGVVRTPLAVPINLICRFLDVVPRAFSRAPHAAVYRGDFDVLLYLAGVCFVAYALRHETRARLQYALAGLFLVAASFMVRPGSPAATSTVPAIGDPRQEALAVSSSGATYVRRGGGLLVLDEGFTRGEAYRFTRELWGRGVREVDLCVVLPARPRRVGGLPYIAKRVSLRVVVCSRYLVAADRSMERALLAAGTTVRPVAAGDTVLTPSFAVVVMAPRFPPARGSSIGADSLRVECRVSERARLTSPASVHSMLTVR